MDYPLESDTAPADRPDELIARLAASQHGVVSRAQLLRAGLSAGSIATRRSGGRLHLLHRGVYAVGFPPTSPLAQSMAAVLACQPTAVLSHRSAAALLDIVDWPREPEITARHLRQRPGIRTYRSRALTDLDTTAYLQIPSTRAARTLLDLADVLGDEALTRAVNQAFVKHRTSPADLATQLERTQSRRGVTRLRRFAAMRGRPTRSTLEDRFARLVECHGLPRPLVNHRVGGFEVDAHWPGTPLIVELDGRMFHSDPVSFERDRRKDAELTAAGYDVLRITAQRLRDEPEVEAARIRALLAEGGRAARHRT